MRGFLAQEAAAAGPRPGVLVVHEGLGLNAHIMQEVQRLAGLGYVALAADMFRWVVIVSTSCCPTV